MLRTTVTSLDNDCQWLSAELIVQFTESIYTPLESGGDLQIGVLLTSAGPSEPTQTDIWLTIEVFSIRAIGKFKSTFFSYNSGQLSI